MIDPNTDEHYHQSQLDLIYRFMQVNDNTMIVKYEKNGLRRFVLMGKCDGGDIAGRGLGRESRQCL